MYASNPKKLSYKFGLNEVNFYLLDSLTNLRSNKCSKVIS